MELLTMNKTFVVFVFATLPLLYFTTTAVASSFSPTDHYLIDCGSTNPTTVDLDNRRFTSDSNFVSASQTASLRDPNPDPSLSPLHHTARVFRRPSKYVFEVKDKGTHLVRLHFNQLNSPHFKFSAAQFHVLVNGYLLLHNFTGGFAQQNPVIKDYLIWVDSEKIVVRLIPAKGSKFAFINAIEVISAPKDLIADVGQFVSSEKNVRINGLMKNGFETVYRVNVGGLKVTPFNDSLWRTWLPDDEFLKSANGSKKVYFSGRINYQLGGASREVGPDNVYNTARVISSSSDSIPKLNITWVFPVTEGYMYLVRMHFCDIASLAVGEIYFNVYLNGNLAYENLDLTSITNVLLASPFYADFVVDGDSSGVLTVGVGPSNMSWPHAIDAILNGIEIMKMNNTMGSLDGEVCVESVLKSSSRGNIGVLVPLVAAVFLLIAASVIMQRRWMGVKDAVKWSPLPVDGSKLDQKI